MYDDEIRDSLIAEIKRIDEEMKKLSPDEEAYSEMVKTKHTLFEMLKAIDDGYVDASKQEAQEKSEKRRDVLTIVKTGLSVGGTVLAIAVIMGIENHATILNPKVLNLATKLLPKVG